MGLSMVISNQRVFYMQLQPQMHHSKLVRMLKHCHINPFFSYIKKPSILSHLHLCDFAFFIYDLLNGPMKSFNIWMLSSSSPFRGLLSLQIPSWALTLTSRVLWEPSQLPPLFLRDFSKDGPLSSIPLTHHLSSVKPPKWEAFTPCTVSEMQVFLENNSSW